MPHPVTLYGPSPWGFRLVGGKDYSQPLTISRVTPGSKASSANLCPGDIIVAINDDSTENMSHLDAQNKIKACMDQLTLSINRNENKPWSPNGIEDGSTRPFQNSLQAQPQECRATGSPNSRKPTPFTMSTNVNEGRQLANAQYNTPAALYTNDNIDHSLPEQLSGLHVASPHIESPKLSPKLWNEVDTESDVYKMLRDGEEPPSEPKQSGSFKMLQGMLEAEQTGERSERPTAIKSIKSPVTKFSNAPPTLQRLPHCTRCETAIVGAVIKAREKIYHPACFMCSDCGLNLKQKGYFFIEEQLYCETHAKARVQPPEGYEVVAVYPNSRV
ncbi:PDZ and LIM domain protein 4-like [Leucoraja erinacea]|uniref:PDZ and LIM domain protein 4-like n=1 Tax=Leucoraja erinaceus TaxID=7782 RepID=UPI00245437EA|nr:PDZ and LIM domain protein 4-like [Leucoraja erinacea]